MSRGRKAKSKDNAMNWQQIFNKNAGKYLQNIIIELSKANNTQNETGFDLLKKIKAEKTVKKEFSPIKAEEIPYEIPKNWVWCRLGDIAELKSGNQYFFIKSDKGIMYVKVGDMNLEGNEYEIITSSSYFEKKSINERDLISIRSIIFPKRGGAIATNKRRAVLRESILVDSNTMAVSPSIEISFDYFFQWFNSIDLSKLGNEGIIPQVNNKDLNPILFPLPPLSEQEKIVDFLNDFENENLKEDGYYFNEEVEQKVIALHESQLKGSEISTELTHQLDLVKKLRQQFLQEAVQGVLIKNGENTEGVGETGAQLLNRIKAEKAKTGKKEKPLPPIKEDEIPFEIPDNWVWSRLGEITDLITSGSRDWAKYYSLKGDIFIRMGNLSKDSFNLRMDKIQYINPPQNQEGNRTKLIEGDILVSITGEVGNLGLIPKDFGEAYINQHTALVRLNKVIVTRFICYLFLSETMKRQFNAPQRGLKNSFRLTDIEYLLTPLPPLSIQAQIVAKLEELMGLCDAIEAGIRESKGVNEALLQQVLREALAG